MDDLFCEVCGAPAVSQVADLRELEPVEAADGRLWANHEIIGRHTFCEEHDRHSLTRKRNSEGYSLDKLPHSFLYQCLPEDMRRWENTLRQKTMSLGIKQREGEIPNELPV